MSKFVSILYKIARAANDISKLTSPKKITKRIGNKIIGRNLIRRFWFK